MFTVGELFAGIGGFSLAFHATGQAQMWYNKHSQVGAGNTRSAANQSSIRGTEMANPDSTPTQRCRKCKNIYPLTPEYFRRHKRYKSGLSTMCRQCCRADAKRYRQENPETLKESRRQFYINHPGYSKQYSNPEGQKVRARRFYVANRHKQLERIREWKLNNPERKRIHNIAYRHRRRQWVQNSETHFTTEDVQSQLLAQGNLCYWCGCELKNNWEVDHYIPLSRGGSNGPDNIVISCQACNRSKHNLMPWEWKGRKS